ncbi:hypothetical protein Ga0080559_TMP267 (plasmid) [Salipiger profundus]|uniref:Uncharacterized protein n=1 Tax=Salipiger profundus TaxID=1229727 RepID=A0A1U7DCF8_9RHOB|nr:hypothetical protein Ga0080559_TMP267 [Salipiger profundus]
MGQAFDLHVLPRNGEGGRATGRGAAAGDCLRISAHAGPATGSP